MTTTELVVIVNELRGTLCRCGSKKAPKQTFCRRCYMRLPVKLQRALYNRVGEGYEEAYTESVEWFDKANATAAERG